MPQKRPRKSTTSKNPNAGEYRHVRPTCPPKTSAQRVAHQTPGPQRTHRSRYPLLEINLDSQKRPIILTLVSSDVSPQRVRQYTAEQASGSTEEAPISLPTTRKPARPSETSNNSNAGEHKRDPQRAPHQTPGSTEDASISLPITRKQAIQSATSNNLDTGEFRHVSPLCTPVCCSASLWLHRGSSQSPWLFEESKTQMSSRKR